METIGLDGGSRLDKLDKLDKLDTRYWMLVKSRIKNQESRIKNQESRIMNPA
jgi:hypothetical protein